MFICLCLYVLCLYTENMISIMNKVWVKFFLQIRLNIARILSEMNVTGFDEMRGMSDTFLALTTKPDEVNFETQVWREDNHLI